MFLRLEVSRTDFEILKILRTSALYGKSPHLQVLMTLIKDSCYNQWIYIIHSNGNLLH